MTTNHREETAVMGLKGMFGVFLVSMGTLMYEILLTRIFSVTMWYHFAFMVVSIAMFGLTIGAVLIHVLPRRFPPEATSQQLAGFSLAYALTLVLSFLLHLWFPAAGDFSLTGVAKAGGTYLLISVPFILGGIVITLVLTRFPTQTGKIYAADLVGAALGCLVLIQSLEATDGPTTVFVCAAAIAFAAYCFAEEAGSTRLKAVSALFALGLLAFVAFNRFAIAEQQSLVPIRYAKGEWERPAVYEKWNTYSRIRVIGDDRVPTPAFGWGLSPNLPATTSARQLVVNIDANAGTVLTAFDGNPAQTAHLRYDISNLAHYLRAAADVCVVGVGGGRDILSALTFQQRSVLGIEVNRDIIDLVTNVFAEFTGRLHERPGVRLVNDEARSYLTRTADRFSIIQVSLIDSWAATAAGAFVLSENTLYTTEAWQLFLQRLKPDGILSFSRWYRQNAPVEIHRLLALAVNALRRTGIVDPRRHLLLARVPAPEHTGDPNTGVGTLLVSPTPFTESDIKRFHEVCSELKFEVALSPLECLDSQFLPILEAQDLFAYAAQQPLNIAPPTDDCPFFFHVHRIRDVFRTGMEGARVETFLLALLGFIGLLTILCVVLPIRRRGDLPATPDRFPLSVYFSGIGLGFMLIEMAFLQWLVVLLGHPTYSLSVVLFSLLLASGVGSRLTTRLASPDSPPGPLWIVTFLGLLAASGYAVPTFSAAQAGAETLSRMATAVIAILPLGIIMGTAFPRGMALCQKRCAGLAPWLWGINGAMSIVGSILAVIIALEWGIAAVFWVGTAAYTAAFLAAIKLRVGQH